MPAKNPRINVSVEKPLYAAIMDMAEDSGISMSMIVRDLIKEAMELKEDKTLAEWADRRMAGLKGRRLLKHEEVWG